MMLLLLASGAWGGAWPERLRVGAELAGAALIGFGAVLLVGGGLQLGASLSPFPKPRARGQLISSGLYRLARHPMYGGGILFAFGWSILFATWPGLVLAAAMAVFLDLKARREEAWLFERYPEYDAYRRQVRHKLIPFVY